MIILTNEADTRHDPGCAAGGVRLLPEGWKVGRRAVYRYAEPVIRAMLEAALKLAEVVNHIAPAGIIVTATKPKPRP